MNELNSEEININELLESFNKKDFMEIYEMILNIYFHNSTNTK